ncbi:cation:proton antiporter [bacterium]|nr:cation:proton antiporter [bacterium]
MQILHFILDTIKDHFSHHIVFSVGILLFTGYFFGKLANKIKLPSITGHIVAGLVLGESVLHMIPHSVAIQLNSVTEIALGLIAITIGAEFNLKRLKKTGSTILLITLFESFFAFIAVFSTLTLFGLDIRYALLLGAIATATAPAATVIIIKELRARGSFIDHLYGVVAFDDSICVLLFSIVFAIVTPLLLGGAATGSGIALGIVHAIKELFFSALIGLIAGIIFHVIARNKHKSNEILIIAVAVIFLTLSIAVALELSLLISNMVLGAVLVNLSPNNRRIFHVLEPITPPVFALFFILAGTELNLHVFSQPQVIVMGLLYLAARFAGKYSGAYTASILTSAPPLIRKYLGFCLFPQAGVAIGLVLFMQTSPVLATMPDAVNEMLVLIVNVVLFSIFINELVGPSITRFGIKRGVALNE